MLVKFSLDDDVFSSQAFKDSFNCAAFDVFRELWLRYGVFVVRKNFNVMSFLEKIPEMYKSDWVAILTSSRFRVFEEQSCWLSLEEYNLKVPSYFGIEIFLDLFTVFISEETYCSDFISSEYYRDKFQGTNFEFMPIGMLGRSDNYSKVKSGFDEVISVGASLDDIWNKRFKDISFYSEKITIVDRYFYKNICEDELFGVGDSSFKYLLKKLLINNKKYIFTIVSSFKAVENDGRIKDMIFSLGCLSVREYLKNYFNKLSASPPLRVCINSLRIVGVEDSFFVVNGHDRYIRFDECVFQVGNGMEFLRESKPVCQTACEYKVGSKVVMDLVAKSCDYSYWEELIV